jgi:hypothetical protein
MMWADIIFGHRQPGIPGSEQTLLAFIFWMIPSTETLLHEDNFIWNKCSPALRAALAGNENIDPSCRNDRRQLGMID